MFALLSHFGFLLNASLLFTRWISVTHLLPSVTLFVFVTPFLNAIPSILTYKLLEQKHTQLMSTAQYTQHAVSIVESPPRSRDYTSTIPELLPCYLPVNSHLPQTNRAGILSHRWVLFILACHWIVKMQEGPFLCVLSTSVWFWGSIAIGCISHLVVYLC